MTHRVAIASAAEAYSKLLSDPTNLGTIIEFPEASSLERAVVLRPHTANSQGVKQAVVALVGPGNFSKGVIAPCLAKTKARLKYVVGRSNPGQAYHLAKRGGFEQVSTDLDKILNDSEVNTIVIATGHDSHASLACKALEAGKHVFVEKPLVIHDDELQKIIEIKNRCDHLQLMVGFNRRFSPHSLKMKELLKARSEALAMTYTVNAGSIPPSVWVHDLEVGGGRIIGEGCHFIDLLCYFADSPIIRVSAMRMEKGPVIRDDKMTIQLAFEDGSIGTVHYFANGSKSFPKEQLTVFSEGRVLHLDNFRKTTGYGFASFKSFRTFSQDKGHQAEFNAFIESVAQGGPPLIPMSELINVTSASFAAMKSASENRIVPSGELQ